jgi:hypothetical protein
MDMTKFAVLKLPCKDFEKYQWQVNGLALKSVPGEKGTVQMLTGKLSGKISDIVTLQATARSNGKLAAFNRSKVQVKSGETVKFDLPLSVGKSGVYDVTITGRSNGSKLFFSLNNGCTKSGSFGTNCCRKRSVFYISTTKNLAAFSKQGRAYLKI